jgi:hypothetical protein
VGKLRLHTRLIRQRGGPIYFRSGGSTVSLVPEVGIREWRVGGEGGPVFQTNTVPAVFVIDNSGVRRVKLRDRRRARMAFAVLAVWACLVGLLAFVAVRSARKGRS